MTTKKNLVKQVLMSILTAGVFCFSFTACSDEIGEGEGYDNQMPEGAKTALLQPYGLTFETFDSENDVQILNADTTQISVSKAYAEKLGYTTFVDHPLGIWHKKSQLPYSRVATAEKIVGDRYILTVRPAKVADMLGNKKVTLNTGIYVNPDAEGGSVTRADGTVMPGYAAKYMDENDIIHPAVIHMTSEYGYDRSYHFSDEQPKGGTRSAEGDYQYLTAEDLAARNSRASIHRSILSFHDELEFDHNFAFSEGSEDSINVNLNVPIDFNLNYFITLNGDIRWKYIIPVPYVEKFEAGLDGSFAFSPQLTIGLKKEWKLDEDKFKKEIVSFDAYTFTFWVGPVPVCIKCKPNLFLKLDGKVTGALEMGVKYEYENNFRGGVRYEDGPGWSLIKEFNELKNSVEFIKPQAKVKAEAGLGLYLGVDVMIYGVVGPEVAVGPRLGAEAELTVSPFAENYNEKVDFSAKMELTVNAVVGAKLEILGYKLAEYTKTIELAGPWTLWKYPSDGSEHVVGSENSISEEWMKVFKAMETGKYSRPYNEDMKATVNMLKALKNAKDEQAKKIIYTQLMKDWKSAPAINDVNCLAIADGLYQYKLEVLKEYEEYQYQIEAEKGNTEWVNAFNWRKICEAIKTNTLSSDKLAWFDKVSDNIHKMFIADFGREPSPANSEDLKWLVNCTLNYDRIMSESITPDRALINRITEEQVIPMYASKYPVICEGTWYDFTRQAYNTEWKETGKKPQGLSNRMKELIVNYALERIKILENEAAEKIARQQKANEDYQKMIQEMMRQHKPFFDTYPQQSIKAMGSIRLRFEKMYGHVMSYTPEDIELVSQNFLKSMVNSGYLIDSYSDNPYVVEQLAESAWMKLQNKVKTQYRTIATQYPRQTAQILGGIEKAFPAKYGHKPGLQNGDYEIVCQEFVKTMKANYNIDVK